jgi:streptogramin lyase
MKQVHSFLRAYARQISFPALAAIFLSCSGAAMAAGLSGTAMTGNLPLTNATVRLWQVGTTGYGSSGTLAGGTTTNSSGQWTISSITCSPANIEVYVIARSENGSGPIRILAFLGPCNALPSNVDINEVTSIAAIWALQQFMHVNSGAIGVPSTNVTGLANAGLNAANLSNVTTGTTPGSALPPGATAPIAKINTLADIMAACDVTGGPPSTPCTSLFSAATPPGDAAPGDTFSAMLYVALFPVNNVNELFALTGPTPPFMPVLPTSPTDWTLAVNYASNGLDAPGSLAIDASGDIWVPNALGNSLSKFNAAGTPLSGGGLPGFSGGGLSIPFAVAIDSNGNAWVTNEGNNSLSEFSSDGTPISTDTGFTGGGLEDPEYLAIDTSNNVWVANCGNFCDKSGVASNVSEFNSSGKELSSSTGYTGGGLDGASGIALDMNGNIWVANEANNSLSEFNSSGMALTPPTGYTGGGLFGPVAVAVSPANYIWVTDQLGNAVSELSPEGAPATGPAGTTGGGIDAPLGIAIDSSRNKWIANSTGIAEINGTGAVISPSTGFVDPKNDEPNGIAIDASGNVWVTNTGNNSLSEFVGVAGPVKTPPIGPPTLP